MSEASWQRRHLWSQQHVANGTSGRFAPSKLTRTCPLPTCTIQYSSWYSSHVPRFIPSVVGRGKGGVEHETLNQTAVLDLKTSARAHVSSTSCVALRLAGFIKALRTLVTSIVFTLKSLVWALVLLFLIIYAPLVIWGLLGSCDRAWI